MIKVNLSITAASVSQNNTNVPDMPGRQRNRFPTLYLEDKKYADSNHTVLLYSLVLQKNHILPSYGIDIYFMCPNPIVQNMYIMLILPFQCFVLH